MAADVTPIEAVAVATLADAITAGAALSGTTVRVAAIPAVREIMFLLHAICAPVAAVTTLIMRHNTDLKIIPAVADAAVRVQDAVADATLVATAD